MAKQNSIPKTLHKLRIQKSSIFVSSRYLKVFIIQKFKLFHVKNHTRTHIMYIRAKSNFQ